HESDPRRVDSFARPLTGPLEKLPDREFRHAPGHFKAQRVGLLVHAKIPAALPALRFAYRTDHRHHRRRDAFGCGDPVRHRVLEVLQLLRVLALGDVLRNTTVAGEAAGGVQYRHAAGADGARDAVRAHALVFVVDEWLARVQLRLHG